MLANKLTHKHAPVHLIPPASAYAAAIHNFVNVLMWLALTVVMAIKRHGVARMPKRIARYLLREIGPKCFAQVAADGRDVVAEIRLDAVILPAMP